MTVERNVALGGMRISEGDRNTWRKVAQEIPPELHAMVFRYTVAVYSKKECQLVFDVFLMERGQKVALEACTSRYLRTNGFAISD
jgi:hypothetical protein